MFFGSFKSSSILLLRIVLISIQTVVIVLIFILLLIMAAPSRLLNHLRLFEEEEGREALLLLIRNRQERRGRRRRRWWVKSWLQRRVLFGQYDTLFQELDRESQGNYMRFIRTDRNIFAELLHRVAPRITKNDGCLPLRIVIFMYSLRFCHIAFSKKFFSPHFRYRIPLDSGLKLAITLRDRAIGDSYKSLSTTSECPPAPSHSSYPKFAVPFMKSARM